MTAGDPLALDRLAEQLLASHPCRFALAETAAERAVAFELRAAAVVGEGWVEAAELPGGVEHDEYDDRAILVIGSFAGAAVSTGRIVLPPGPLPTEDACGLVVEPRGSVADVGRMVVAPAAPPGSFVALLSRLYLEVRAQGFDVACGMMAPNVRGLLRHLGVAVTVLGPERTYWHDQRAPVRFEAVGAGPMLVERWG